MIYIPYIAVHKSCTAIYGFFADLGYEPIPTTHSLIYRGCNNGKHTASRTHRANRDGKQPTLPPIPYIYRAKQRQAQMKGGDTEPRLPHTVEKLTNKGEIEKWQTKNYVA